VFALGPISSVLDLRACLSRGSTARALDGLSAFRRVLKHLGEKLRPPPRKCGEAAHTREKGGQPSKVEGEDRRFSRQYVDLKESIQVAQTRWGTAAFFREDCGVTLKDVDRRTGFEEQGGAGTVLGGLPKRFGWSRAASSDVQGGTEGKIPGVQAGAPAGDPGGRSRAHLAFGSGKMAVVSNLSTPPLSVLGPGGGPTRASSTEKTPHPVV